MILVNRSVRPEAALGRGLPDAAKKRRCVTGA